jgi:putative aldouronate transport system permease protein
MLNIFCHSDYGVINKILNVFGRESIAFITDRRWFRSLYVVSGIWQNAGWGSIVYLSALSGIDPQLHESAMIDGASRLKRIWHINLPGILPTISLLFILQVGGLMSVGFEKVFLMQNPLNLELSEVISTYVYKVGLLNFQFSFSSAVGLFNSMINCTLLVITNYVSKSLSGSGLF